MLYSRFPLAIYCTHGSVYIGRRQCLHSVFLPGESRDGRSPGGLRPEGGTEVETTNGLAAGAAATVYMSSA